MLKIAIAIAPLLAGCSSLGYFSNSDFIAALNAKPRQCDQAYKMLGNTFSSDLDAMTHHGLWEFKCGDSVKGEAMLYQAAQNGDAYAKRIMVNHRLKLPDPSYTPSGGGAPTINVWIR